jgi:signal transduction histidine kinase
VAVGEDDWDERRLRRAADVFRVAALIYAAVLHVIAHDEYRRPWAGWVVLGVLAAWTAFLLLHPDPVGTHHGTWVLVTDLALTSAAVLATRFVDDLGRIATGAQTLPSIYPGAVVLTWAIWRGWRGGLVAAAVIAVADIVELLGVAGPTAQTVNNIVLLMLTAVIVGYGLQLVRAGRADLADAVELRAATAERERLARDIHDSVLQVLGYVSRGRRDGAGGGLDTGHDADLARLATEAEARLRGLVSTGPVRQGATGTADLRAELAACERGGVTVSGPAEPVLLPAGVAAAVTAAVGAALDNVTVHAGDGAKAWVLVEDEPHGVTVTVRDDGVGCEPARLDAAAAEGRLGVAASIRGRIRDVGGTVQVTSSPGQGTEVELRVPRRAGPGASR